MCRWLAYSGSPVLVEELLLKPKHSLIDQSLHSTLGATRRTGTASASAGTATATCRACSTASSRRGTTAICARSPSHRVAAVLAHIRASTGGAIQQTNCHPFRHGRWLWMHNGVIRGFHEVKRDLAFAVDPSLYAEIEGSTDSELFFHLALTFGLEDDPPGAVARAVGFIEKIGRDARRRAPDPDDGGDDRRRQPVGVPLLERGAFAVAVLSARTSRPCAPSIPTTPSSTASQTRRGSSSRSRWATSRARGTRCPSRATASSRPGRTSCGRSRREARSVTMGVQRS